MDKLVRSFIVVLCFLTTLYDVIHGFSSYLDIIDHYQVVIPSHIRHDRNKRDLSTHHGNMGNHLDETKFVVTAYGKTFIMHLHRNKILLPSNFIAITQNLDGSDRIEKGIEKCYYHGHLGNQDKSFVVIDTCDGLKGLLHDEDGEEYFIEPHTNYNKSYGSEHHNKHVFYKMKDLKLLKNGKCGNHEAHNTSNDYMKYESGYAQPLLTDHFRKRRATDEKKYIEVVVVLDNRNLKRRGSVSATQKRGVEVMNYVDAVYKTMDTRVALVGVIVWNIFDKISVSVSAGDTLNNFRKYTSEVLYQRYGMKTDNAQLLSGVDFTGSLVGLAGIGVMCSPSSCAVNQDHNANPAVSANTVAHEMGHNLGLYHNTASCSCPKEPCVMGEYAAATQVKSFTSCASTEYEKRLNKGEIPCLFDYPDDLWGNPKCGNGFVEKGEMCDCGTVEECRASGADKCCIPSTCKLQSNAECADGPCCDKCKFKAQGILCRDKFNEECDFPEYCFGNSSECPRNFYATDGKPCESGTAYCYQGSCRSFVMQCQGLWGPNAVKANDICFGQNSKPSNQWGNCGKNDRGEYVQCAEVDRFCGKLQCAGKSDSKPLPKFPIIGRNRQAKTVNFYIGDKVIPCKMGITSFGGDLDDPTIALDGSLCGDKKLCIDHKCTAIASLTTVKECKTKCLNGGVCNNNGNCHCPPGFACPNCEFAGPGGSSDSGQGCINQDSCGCLTPLVKGMLILFLLILPLLGLIAFLCYRYRELLRRRWSTYRTSKGVVKQEKATSSKQYLQTGTTGSSREGLDNPYITYSHTSSPAPPAPKRSPNVSRPGYIEKKEYYPVNNPKVDKLDNSKLPPIGGSSPRPGKLPQISAYDAMDKQAGTTSVNRWPPTTFR